MGKAAVVRKLINENVVSAWNLPKPPEISNNLSIMVSALFDYFDRFDRVSVASLSFLSSFFWLIES